MKICINCDFYKEGDCCHHKNINTDMVTGKRGFLYSCDEQRNGIYADGVNRSGGGFIMSRFMGLCGKSGRWFKAKN